MKYIWILYSIFCSFPEWHRVGNRPMEFAIRRIWRETTDHKKFFCIVNPSNSQAGKNTPVIKYPDVLSSINPVKRCPEHPITTPPKRKEPSSEKNSTSEEDIDPDLRGAAEERNPYYRKQKDFNGLMWDLGFTKSNVELSPQAVEIVSWKCASRMS